MEQDNRVKIPRQTGAINRRHMPIAAGIIVLVVIVIFLLYPKSVEEPQQAIPAVSESVTSGEERGDTAREIIQALQVRENVDYGEAYRQGREFHEQGRLADAQLLYFFAARGRHAQAAFELATTYDPLHHSTGASLMDEPDPFQAYKWYQQATEDGHGEAGPRLEKLHAWAEDAAGQGDINAEQLLLIWE